MKIAVLAGDGIGPEIMEEAVKVLNVVEEKFDRDFEFTNCLIGGAAYDKYGDHFPDETRDICEKSDAILFGSVGGPVGSKEEKWQGCETNSILGVRKHFGFNINLRPVKTYKSLIEMCVLKPEIIGDGIDILTVRELSSGIYFGEHKLDENNASDLMEYDRETIERIAHSAFKAAMGRRKKVSSVDKANVLSCGKLWRSVVDEVAKDYPDCELEHVLVDNCAMQVIKNPSQFDVMLMPNMFGDIISDEISVLGGSLGMAPSASLNADGFGMYEPSGGSAQDIAGQGIANPIGQILSAGMMLRHSFGMDKEAAAIDAAVEKALEDGYRTGDIAGGGSFVSTEIMGDVIANNINHG